MPHRPSAQDSIEEALLLLRKEEWEGALELLESLATSHDGYPDVHHHAGVCHAMLGRSAEALRDFDRAIELAPSFAQAHLNRGIVLLELGKHDEAREALEKADRLDHRWGGSLPSDVGHRIAGKHGELGDLYARAGRWERAEREYREGLDVRATFLDLRSKHAGALAELGRLHEALDALTMVLQANPLFPGARVRLGVVLRRLGDEEGAEREWRRAMSDFPGDTRACAYLASLGRSE